MDSYSFIRRLSSSEDVQVDMISTCRHVGPCLWLGYGRDISARAKDQSGTESVNLERMTGFPLTRPNCAKRARMSNGKDSRASGISGEGKSVRSCVSNDARGDAVRVAEKSTFQRPSTAQPQRNVFSWHRGGGAGIAPLRKDVILTAPWSSFFPMFPLSSFPVLPLIRLCWRRFRSYSIVIDFNVSQSHLQTTPWRL